MAGPVRFSFFALHPQLVGDLAGAKQHALRVEGALVRNDGQEAWPLQLRKRRRRLGMTQHALRSKADERLAPLAQRLAAKQVEVLPRGRRLAHLHVVACAELQIALDAGAGVFRTLAFVAVRQQQTPGRVSRSHLSSPAAMNWSMMICAPLAKSPNCASHITSASG